MKKIIFSISMIAIMGASLFSQIDTISTNIYQSEGRLGIGTNNPVSSLSILSEDIFKHYERLIDLRINGSSESFLQLRNNSNASNVFEPCIHGSTDYADRAGLMIMGNILEDGDNNDNAIITVTPFVDNGLGWENNGYDYPTNRHYFRIRGFKSGIGNKYLFEIDQDGNIGIGTELPQAKLEVADGDIYLSDIEKGIIMKSPDGNCWRGVLDNTGNLNFTQIDCPEVAFKDESILKSSSKVSLYPNPVESSFNIVVEDGDLKKLRYSVYDLNGKILDKGKITNNHKSLNISSYDSGIFM